MERNKWSLMSYIAAYEKYLRFSYTTVMVISGILNEIEMVMEKYIAIQYFSVFLIIC